MSHQKESSPPRAIANPTGTACHLSSALVLLFYCVEPVRQLLLTSHQHMDDLMHALACLFRAMESSDKVAVDPTFLYSSIRKSIGVQAHELGDAVTAMIKLLHHLRLESEHQAVWNDWIDAGRVHSLLQGYRSGLAPSGTPNYSRTSPIRSMPVPFRVSAAETRDKEVVSLPELIRQALAPRVVKGYQWPDADETTTTTRSLHLDVVPPIWMIHLDRFVWKDGSVRAVDSTIRIPLHWSVREFTDDDSAADYDLVGGILHVDDRENDSSDEEGGHYIAVVRHQQEWYLLDDDTTTPLSSGEQVVRMLSGADDPNEKQHTRGILLVYHRTDLTYQLSRLRLLSCFDEQDGVDWTRPEFLVGKRVRVQWSKGKYYAGIVSAYNHQTGQHEVQYDDGDVCLHQLRKKTIVWEEPGK